MKSPNCIYPLPLISIFLTLPFLLNYFLKAGLINLEVDFEEWQWEEQLTVFTIEHVGLGRYLKFDIFSSFVLLALIINAAGLGTSSLIFVIEKLISVLKKC